ncbi:unnamed protein product [marine sediment metagenome]|uniref:Methyltransferase domain-containing protein n=1 Tax=marine sediment metagenome TaxID=412755 RepID=X0YKM1_9ZZZZ
MDRRGYAEVFDSFQAKEDPWGNPSSRRSMFKALLSWVATRRYKRILEVGCSGGYFTDMLVKADLGRVWALDVSTVAVERARSRYPSHTFVVGDVRDIKELFDFSFDLILCMDVLYYLTTADLDELFEAFMDRLTPKGRLLAVLHLDDSTSLTGTNFTTINEHCKSLFGDPRFKKVCMWPDTGWGKAVYFVEMQEIGDDEV